MIKTLRASGSQLQADVVVGSNQYGSDVAVQVKLDRKDPELVEALAPLMELLTTRANAFLEDSAVERRVQARVRTDVDKKIKSEKERLERLAQTRVDILVDQVRRLVGSSSDRSLEPWEVRRLMTTLDGQRSTSAEAASA